MNKIHLKEKHWQLGRHFARFVDRRWYPDFTLTEANLHAFIKWESYGQKSLDQTELDLVKPLLNAKIHKELTIKMLIEECAEWWSGGNGWYAPIAHIIQEEFKNRAADKVFIRALIKIMRDIKQNGFMSVLDSFTGLDRGEKDKYIGRYLNNLELQRPMKPLNIRLEKTDSEYASGYFAGGALYQKECDKIAASNSDLVNKVCRESERANFWANVSLYVGVIGFCAGMIVGILLK
jgi:hypothetical protein